MILIKYRKILYIFSATLVAASIGVILFLGLHFGIEFTGGEIAEVRYGAPQSAPVTTTTQKQQIQGQTARPSKVSIETKLDKIGIGAYSLRAAGTNKFILRTKSLTESSRGLVLGILNDNGGSVESFNSVGPTIGTELRNKAWIAMLLVIFLIIIFVAFAFRGVSKPVTSWKYGVIAIIALLHDVIIPTGVFALLGHFYGAEVNVLFVMALLAILGYSVNDTIVVFDRVRENLKENEKYNRKEEFDSTVGKSLRQTYARSINTSLTTLLALFALYFVGAPVTQHFALVLIAGIIAGTFSSIALASPLLVTVQKLGKKNTV